ncbi:hypothetical protein BDFB_013042, partial [Asbolus verrucosus]
MHWIGHVSVNQGCVQKFLAVPTFRDSVLSVIYFGIGMTVVKTICILTGLVMYAKYSDCDPFTTKEVTRNDQLLPYYVMDVARNIPGLSGLFIAGVFSAALSLVGITNGALIGMFTIGFLFPKANAKVKERYMTNKNDPPIDKSLISPVSYWLLPKKSKIVDNVQYESVQKALHTVTINSQNEN